jgi:CO/xanthine dehydrogenase Mo-binding subunit
MPAVGQRILRYDGLEHVTGKTLFIDDLSFPGMLYTKALGSPHPNARILNIDTSRAERLAGVATVATHKDVKNNRYGALPDEPVLADDYVRYIGQPIAAVAAVDEDTAQEAVSLIQVDYEPLEPVFDPLFAMTPEAPVIHEGGNIAYFGDSPSRRIRMGDVEKAFAEADLIVEGTYRTQSAEHAQLEPHVGIAVPEPKGRIAIYTVSQCIYFHAGQLSAILGLPLSKIHMIGGTVGGGFGAKNDLATDHVISILAMKCGKPVKWRWTRQEEFLISSNRNPWYMEYKDGVKKNGKIIARKIRSVQDTGAYNLWGSMCMDKHCFMNRGPYNIPNIWVDGYVVYTNKQPTGAMRGFGVTQPTFAWETQIDKIADALGMDKLEIRLINALHDGDVNAAGQTLDAVAVEDTLLAAAKAAGWPIPAQYSTKPEEVSL